MKRRAAVEPSVGHLKMEHRLERNRLKGVAGDALNSIPSAAAMNFHKLLEAFRRIFRIRLIRFRGWAPALQERFPCKLSLQMPESGFFRIDYCNRQNWPFPLRKNDREIERRDPVVFFRAMRGYLGFELGAALVVQFRKRRFNRHRFPPDWGTCAHPFLQFTAQVLRPPCYLRTLNAAAPSANCENNCDQSMIPRKADDLNVFSGTTMVSPGYRCKFSKSLAQSPLLRSLLTTSPLARMMNSCLRSPSLLEPPANRK
jgi:hypothetical protein